MKRVRHYRAGEYEIICEGIDEATLEPVIVYKSLYAAKDFAAGTIWVRRKKIFDEMVEFEGKQVPRFTIIS